MEFLNLQEEMAKAKRKIDLYGTDNFRSWLLYFVPGDGTDMHYHASPETFLVFSGNGVVKGSQGRGEADQAARCALSGRQGLLSDCQYRNRAFGAVRQPLRGLRRCAYPAGWQGPQQAAEGRVIAASDQLTSCRVSG